MKRILAAISLFAVATLSSVPASAVDPVWPNPTTLLVDVSMLSRGIVRNLLDNRASGDLPTALKVGPGAVFVGGDISGVTNPDQLVEMTITSPGGAVKAIARTVSDAEGDFNFAFGPGNASVRPGDTLTFVLAESPAFTYSAVLPFLRVTAFDLATGRVFGRVTPRQDSVFFAIRGTRVVPDQVDVARHVSGEWESPPGKRVTANGRFSFKPALTGDWAGAIRRNDQYYLQTSVPLVAGDENFQLRVFTMGMVPGLVGARIGSSSALLGGSFSTSYRARLVSRTGALKGTDVASLGVLGPYGLLNFHTANGRPALIRSGDTIRVAGLGGFSKVVPPLRGVIDTTTNSVRIHAPRNAFVFVGFDLYDDTGEYLSGPDSFWVKTDASGEAVVGPVDPFTLRVRDWVNLSYVDARGHQWHAEYQALP